ESAFDETLAFDLKFRLGKAYRQIGEIDKAIEYLDEYLKKCQSDGDRAKEGPAQAALASCYETSGNLVGAIDHLQQFIDMTEDVPTQRPALAHACNQLGILYNKTGQYEHAVKFFDKHFSLVRTIASEAPKPKTPLMRQDLSNSNITAKQQGPANIDDTRVGGKRADSIRSDENIGRIAEAHSTTNVGLAQVQLGISRGNAEMESFFNYVVESTTKPSSIQSLLKWKAKRNFADAVETLEDVSLATPHEESHIDDASEGVSQTLEISEMNMENIERVSTAQRGEKEEENA
ncbi:hypothetical protein HDU67_002230, partial [Dinochytrium kinnereticum]